MMRKIPYPHPGEILIEEFLKPMGITQYHLAKEIGVPQLRIGEIVSGTRGVTADIDLHIWWVKAKAEDSYLTWERAHGDVWQLVPGMCRDLIGPNAIW